MGSQKATADYLSSINGHFNWRNTTEDQQQQILRTSTTNDAAETPFVTITKNKQRFDSLT